MYTKYAVLITAVLSLITGLVFAGVNIALAVVITGSVMLIAITASDLVITGEAKETAETKNS